MFIEEFNEVSKSNAEISGTFVINKCELKPFKNKQGFFLNCQLSDRTGTIRGIVWDNAELMRKNISNKTVVAITGECTRYNDTPQIIIKTARTLTEYDKSLFLPLIDADIYDECIQWLKSQTIEDPFYNSIWKCIVFDNPKIGLSQKFKECPGGVGGVHHNYIGGLLEHSTFMARMAHWRASQTGSGLDKDLIRVGALIHDIGKIHAYNWDIVIEMNDYGRLLHHVPIGVMILNNLVYNDLYPDISNQQKRGIDLKLMKLLHIIVSHHDGEEQGHRPPMIPEAFAISRIDSLDAAVRFSVDFSNKEENWEEESNWTKFNNLMQRRFYRGPQLEEPLIPPKNSVKNIIEEDSIF